MNILNAIFGIIISFVSVTSKQLSIMLKIVFSTIFCYFFIGLIYPEIEQTTIMTLNQIVSIFFMYQFWMAFFMFIFVYKFFYFFIPFLINLFIERKGKRYIENLITNSKELTLERVNVFFEIFIKKLIHLNLIETNSETTFNFELYKKQIINPFCIFLQFSFIILLYHFSFILLGIVVFLGILYSYLFFISHAAIYFSSKILSIINNESN